MAMKRSRAWSGAEHLLSGERIVRQARARLLASAPPHRWEGVLVVTTDRLLFVPDVYNELIGDAALWLAGLIDVNAPARERLHAATRERSFVFELPGLLATIRGVARGWVKTITLLQQTARAPDTFADTRRRVG
jgi:hypothetical protein